MYCTAYEFIDIATKTGASAHDLKESLSVVLALVKKYGSLLKSQTFQDAVAKEDANIAAFVTLLHGVDKLDAHSLKELLSYVDKAESGLVVIKGSDIDHIKDRVTAKLDASSVELEETAEVGLQIQSDGNYYKRTLDRDLEKLVG